MGPAIKKKKKTRTHTHTHRRGRRPTVAIRTPPHQQGRMNFHKHGGKHPNYAYAGRQKIAENSFKLEPRNKKKKKKNKKKGKRKK